ncbi:hypothetical protein [Hymenobacter cheonanensis]|uniref:hypothetical protein n=1 Tax=Hymenobacter sp. CA2-7 TaxID=3063993 RepID=UPI002712F3AD|nr:hypothetical protein [Hymenobacter sp. CA2-7]MDO7888182.1 hypothetical protein [Hymenobacter sp. CA2-7]
MKERLEVAEKTLLLSIPYLIVLSLAYYWGYWGYFDIDAISYYGVQDLVKGFAYALPGVLVVGVMLIIGNKVLDWLVLTIRKRFSERIINILLSVLWLAFAYFLFNDKIPNSTTNWIGPAVAAMLILFVLELLFIVIKSHWAWALKSPTPFFLIKWSAIFVIISFFSSYSYGKNSAKSIGKNKHFSYAQLNASSDSIKVKLPFKYLGKAGDYYFFLSSDNKEKRIISTQKIPDLILYDYDENDSTSTRAYRSVMKHI